MIKGRLLKFVIDPSASEVLFIAALNTTKDSINEVVEMLRVDISMSSFKNGDLSALP